MNKQWGGDCLSWAIVATLIIGFANLISTATDLGRPYGGFLANRNYGNNLWYVRESPPWWPTLTGQGVIIEINREPYNATTQWQVYENAHKNNSKTVELTREYYGATFSVTTPVVLFSLADYIDIFFPYWIIGLSGWLLAIVVYQAEPEAELNRVFSWLMTMLAAQQWLFRGNLFPDSDWYVVILPIFVMVVFAPAIVGLLFHFSLIFPEPLALSPKWSRLVKPAYLLVYGWSAMIGGAFLISRITLYTTGWSQDWVSVFDTWAINQWVASFLVCVGLIILRASWVVWRAWGEKVKRWQALSLVFGWGSTIPILVPTALSYLGFAPNFFGYWHNWDLRFLYMVVPLSYAFIILRFRAFQYVSSGFLAIALFILSAIFAGLADATIRTSTFVSFSAFSVPPILVTFSLALGTGIFWRHQLSRSSFFGRGANWEAHSYDSLRRFNDNVVSKLELATLPNPIPKELVNELKFERVAIWRWDKGLSKLNLATYADSAGFHPPEMLDASLAELIEMTAPIELTDEKAKASWLLPLKHTSQWVAINRLFIAKPEVVLGLIAVGKRQDEDKFDRRDLKLLSLISSQITLLIFTLEQFRERERTFSWALQAEERERTRIARDLHDGIQQFIGALGFALTNVETHILPNPTRAIETLRQIAIQSRLSDAELRDILRDLTPYQVESDISTLLLKIVVAFYQRTGINVEKEIAVDIGNLLSPKAQHALYRVIRQALDNIEHHANATQVNLRIRSMSGRIEFAITDNGIGFTETDRREATSRNHFGILFMEERLHELGGNLIIDSVIGRGTTLNGWLPTHTQAKPNKVNPSG